MAPSKTFNPFPGLRPFESNEDHLFFGRDGQSVELLSSLRTNRFLVVVGTSGSGKSSLVRAGLLPSLYAGFMVKAGSKWRVAVVRPGSAPIGNLASGLSSSDVFGVDDGTRAMQQTVIETTLRRGTLGLVDAVKQARIPPNENLLIVVDQFEEIFRFKRSLRNEQADNEAAAFVKLLLEATQQKEFPVYVVLTMRSDYLGDCAQFRDLPEAINDSQYLIPWMTRDQRREAIEGPVVVGGAQISPRLVNRLLNDVGDNPDQLPILQHALMRTWNYWWHNHRDSEPIDVHHYEEIGGMSDALSKHADEAYDELPDDRSKEIAEKIFRCLTEKVSDNRETRRPTTVRDICAIIEAKEQEVLPVIEAFRREGRSFLTPPPVVALDADTLTDISHESLIRNWKRLKDWVGRESLSATTYRRVADRAVLFRERQAELLGGRELEMALAWREGADPNRAWAERYNPEFESSMAFLDASGAARDAEAYKKEQRRKGELRRTRLFAFILGTAFLLASALGVFAFIERDKAEKQSSEAEQQRRNAEEQTRVAKQHQEAAEEARKEAYRQKGIVEEKQRETATALQDAKEAKEKAERERKRASLAEAAAVEQAHQEQLTAIRARKQSLTTYGTIVALANVLITKSPPNEAPIWRQYKAQALSQIGSHEGAIAQDTLVLKTDDKNLRSRFHRSHEYLSQGDAVNALKDTDDYLSYDTKFWPIHQNRALALGLLGDYDAADKSISEGLNSFTQTGSEFFESEISPDIQLATRRKVLIVSEQAARIALYYERATLKACAGDAAFEQALRDADFNIEESNSKKPDVADGYLFAINWAWMHSKRGKQDGKEDYGALAIQGALWERAGFRDWAWTYLSKFQERHAENPDPRYYGLAKWVKRQMTHFGGARDRLSTAAVQPSPDMLACQAQELLTEVQLSLAEKATQRVQASRPTQQAGQEALPPSSPQSGADGQQSASADQTRSTEKQVAQPSHPRFADKADKLELAHQRITEALDLEHDNIGFLMQRVLINNQRQDYLEVQDDCDAIIKLAPRTAFAYYWRALASSYLIDSDRNPKADMQKAIEYDPSYTEGLWSLSDGALDKNPDEAARLLDQSFRSNVNFWQLPGLHRRKAEIEVQRNNHKAAYESIQTAIQMDEINLGLYDYRATIEVALGKNPVVIARDQAEGYARAADIEQKLGQSIEALDVYRRALGILTRLESEDRKADVNSEMTAIIPRVSDVLIDLGSKEKAATFWRIALKTGYLKGHEEIIKNEIDRLSEALRP